MSMACWLRFDTITRVIGVEVWLSDFDWDISGTGLVLSLVENLFLILVEGLVSDNGNISGLSGDDSSVLGVVLSVVSSLRFSSVLSLMLSSVVSVEDSVIASLLIFSVENGVLVGV